MLPTYTTPEPPRRRLASVSCAVVLACSLSACRADAARVRATTSPASPAPEGSTPTEGSVIGRACKAQGDCVRGSRCVHGTCDAGPCSGTIEGSSPRAVEYRYDDEGYETLRLERRHDSAYLRTETRWEAGHLRSEQRAFHQDAARPDTVFRFEYDELGRATEETWLDAEGNVLLRKRYRYPAPACPLAPEGEITSADGAARGRITSTCDDQGRLATIRETNAAGEPEKEKTILRDAAGRYAGMRIMTFLSSGKPLTTEYSFERDARGLAARSRLHRSWEPAEEVEVFDTRCIELSAAALRRRRDR